MRDTNERIPHWLPPVSGRGKIGGWIVWGLFALILVLIAWLQLADPMGDQGFSNALTMMLCLLAAVVWLLWFLLGSGHAWWLRLGVPVAALALVWIFFSVFRLSHMSGAFVPRFELRSTEKADRLLELPEGRVAGIDLLTTTPDDFPQFLGPHRNLGLDRPRLARDWDARPPKLLWRHVIGAGWAGIAVVNGHAITQEQRGDNELVTAYDAATGEIEWSHATATRFGTAVAGAGPRATPTVDEGIVYSQGATGRLLALDGATGQALWEKDLVAEFGMTAAQEAAELPYGRSGSPLVVGDLVVVPAGGPASGRQVSLVAFHKKTGEKVWEGGDEQISCSSPALATLGGVEQILIVNEASATGHDSATGRVLWRHPWEGASNANANVSQAVALAPDRVFLSKGYGVGAALLKLKPKGDGAFEAEELWRSNRSLRTKFTNVAIKDGFVYGLSDGILECVDLETGERRWKGGRYQHGQILLVGDLLLVLAESGEVFLIAATPEQKNHVLGKFQAIEGKTWNNFALYGSRLLVRNGEEVAAYELPVEG